MRSDMYKVIVERPRNWKCSPKDAERIRKNLDGPMRLGMRRGLGYRALNENLNPLKRYLRAQVGRPWNKVHGEIAAGIDRRNTVQQHIFAHIEDFIAVRVEWVDGRWVDTRKRHGVPRLPGELWQELFVDPRSGLIRVNKLWHTGGARRRARRAAARDELDARRRRVDANTVLARLDGQWYEVKLAELPEDNVFDVVLKRNLRRGIHDDLTMRRDLYGGDHIYAAFKRQLSRREIASHRLPSSAKPAAP